MVSLKCYFFQASIFLVMLFVAPSSARLSVKVTAGVINDICSKTHNPSFCLGFLNKIPGVSSADIPGLAKITMNLASSNATRTLQLVKSFVPKTTDGKLKEAYSSCSEHYEDIIGDFDDAQQYLKTGDPMGVSSAASASMDNAGGCDDELKGLPAEPSILKDNQDMYNMCSVILIIANLLPR